MALTHAIIGVDVGGTNTDAVILNKTDKDAFIISKAKTFTTADVTTGVNVAIHLALINSRKENRVLAVQQVNIGTTHFINAIVEGKRLSKVSVIRLCGTASRKLPPFSDFPESLSSIIKGRVFLVNGGYQFNGAEIDPINEEEITACVRELKEAGEGNIVVSGIFSPVRQDQEHRVVAMIQELYPEASVTASNEIGKLGLLERENAAILNECIKQLCLETITGLRASLSDLGLKCPMYLTQNDGTVIPEEVALKYPVLTFASGMTNSMRGAAFLSKVNDAIVLDIGGTSTDVGILLNGFPREASTEVTVGGVRTNFRMPDVISIGLGGGSYVVEGEDIEGNMCVTVGPKSASYNIQNEALVFAKSMTELKKRTITATDIAIASKIASLEDANEVYTQPLKQELISKAVNVIHDKVACCIDQMRFNDRELPLILVGGGSILIDESTKFAGISNIIKPENLDVANAVGAALSQVSATVDRVVDLSKYMDNTGTKISVTEEQTGDQKESADQTRKNNLEQAKVRAIQAVKDEVRDAVLAAGGNPESLALVEKEDVALSYIPGDATRIKVKMVADLNNHAIGESTVIAEGVYKKQPAKGTRTAKQSIASSGKLLLSAETEIKPHEPNVDPASGEWLISEYDVECISIGAGILGCGGGGNPAIGRLLALKMLRENKTIRVLRPSRFLKDAHPENDLVTLVAFMGAPMIMYEKLVSGIESTNALRCIQDLYGIGKYADGELGVTDGVNVEEKSGVKFVDDYNVGNKTPSHGKALGTKNIVGIMCAEVGGMNSIEPLLVGGELNLPILDCDGMGRAFPELQMFCPFMYDCKPYPCALADDKGRRAVVLKADSPKQLEDYFRDVVISMGCSGGVVLSHFNKDEIMTKTVHHSLSHAWRIGDTIIKARLAKRSPIQAVIESEHGKLLIHGKIADIQREVTGGFNKGKLIIEGLDDCKDSRLSVEFQNEFLIARDDRSGEVLACVPDLITLMDADTAQPIPTEEVRFGIRVVVAAFRAHPLISSEKALTFVGPQAFGYPEDVKYVPLCKFVDTQPIPPQ